MLIPNCHKPEFVYDSAGVNEWRRNSTLLMTRSRTYEWAHDGSDPLEAAFLRFQLHYLLYLKIILKYPLLPTCLVIINTYQPFTIKIVVTVYVLYSELLLAYIYS